MRRTLFICFHLAMCVLCLSLWGCGKPRPPEKDPTLEKLSGNFSSVVQISCGDLSATATLQRSPGDCRMSFTQPDSLRDMEVVFGRDDVRISYRELEFSFSPGSVPETSVPQQAVSVIDSLLRKDNLTLERTENVLRAEGRSTGGAFVALLDVPTGAILKLSVPSQDLEIVFSDFQFSR